ncbi:uncharacterized protein EKO05_0006422 [Ascochyta rabiei]|uniref:Uncharacterized protein n=1 Tax=Didymella rabiei TaxID=5454 RepID=A0A162WRL6_DIDRA|nr:uncharacterized protein EKO05_0006422 [Ascochyta rabiei]KZM19178.1 hypothetical protein ST47_g9656 [Ascochyta rabiei]UPX15997.1 hypothetical protein EKO05_0006422 [Ascochyta rabiei]
MTSTTESPFLDMLPPELRLHIYDYLLVADEPLRGISARRTTKHGLDTKIFRVNKRIYAEARSVFFGKNTFYITSMPSQFGDDVEGSGAFEPPLQVKDLPLIRHLTIDPLYYPKKLMTEPGVGGGKPICPAAERYVMNLTHLLAFVKSTLLSLSFKADTRPYASFSDEVYGAFSPDDESSEEESLDVRKMLTGFHVIEGNRRFTKAMSELTAVRSIPVAFSFPESDFNFNVEKSELCKRGLLFLACQTVFARSEIKIKAMLGGLSDDGLDEVEEEEANESAYMQADAEGGQRRQSVCIVQGVRRVVELLK